MEELQPILIIANYLTQEDSSALKRLLKARPTLEWRLVCIMPTIPARFFQLPSTNQLEKRLFYQEHQHLMELSRAFHISPMHCFLEKNVAATLELIIEQQIKTIFTSHPKFFKVLTAIGGGDCPAVSMKPSDLIISRVRESKPLLSHFFNEVSGLLRR